MLDTFRTAARSLGKHPSFTLAAVLTLALGMGATTAVFSVVNGVVLSPLPYPDSDRIVFLGWSWGADGGEVGALSPNSFEHWRTHATVFDLVATHRTFQADASPGPEYDAVSGLRVSDDFLELVGAEVVVGRGFLPAEHAPGGPRVAMLGHDAWRTRFASDAGVLGRTISLDGEPFTVVGVLPADFRVVGVEAYDDVVVPLQLDPDPRDLGANYTVMARLRPGVGEAQADADVARVFPSFLAQHPDLIEPDEGIYIARYNDVFIGELRVTLWILLGATVAVLLIGCANVANLLLARATGRQREIATRYALGAARGRIVRELIAESLVFSVLAGAAGLLLGVWSLDALLALAPWQLPRAQDVGLDARVLAFALLIAVVTGVTVGLASAWASSRADPLTVLRTGGRGGDDRGRTRARSGLIVIETAVSLVLLVAAGLLIGSFAELVRIDPGLDAEDVLTVRFDRTPDEYDAARVLHVDREVLERVRALPGVSAAASISILPFGGQWNMPVTVEGRPDATEGAIQWRSISPGYFDAMRIPIVRGRAFTAADASGAPGVAIITESTARHYWPDGEALGQRILLGVFRGQIEPDDAVAPLEVVGIVPDLRDIRPDWAPLRRVFIPHAQTVQADGLPGIVVRTSDATTSLRERIASAIAAVDPSLPAPAIRPLGDLVSTTLAPQRFTMLLTTLFATLALVLTVIGIFGVVSYAVGQRRREIGIRMALGGRRLDMVRLVVRQAMLPVFLGLAAGLALAAAATRVLAASLFGVSVRDPLTFGIVAAILAVVGLVASLAPGVRAAHISPIEALRLE